MQDVIFCLSAECHNTDPADADKVVQALMLLSKDSRWLNVMAKCEGAWCLPKHALAKRHLEPLLQDLDSHGALSGTELTLIRHFYTDLLVSKHTHIIV